MVDSVPREYPQPEGRYPSRGHAQAQRHGLLITLAIYRFILPDKRYQALRGKRVQPAPAPSAGPRGGMQFPYDRDYLTTTGRNLPSISRWVTDLGLVPVLE